jgi:hypothetical protein
MNLRARLRRLERTTIDAGCPACRERRGWTVLLTARRLPDGTVAPVEGEPQPCVRCGQVPEQIIAVVEVIEPAVADRTSPS